MSQYETQQPERIGNLIKEIQQAVSRERNRYWAKYGLTASQTDVLLYILRNTEEEINQVDIKRRLHLSNPTVAGIIKRLEARGFIEKRPSKKDARYNAICPTEKAIEEHRRGMENPQQIDTKFLEGLSQQECDDLERSLGIVLHNMRRMLASHIAREYLD